MVPARSDGRGAEPFSNRVSGWLDLIVQAANLHPITRACIGFHLWSLAGLGQQGDRVEAAVTVARIAASEGKGAVFRGLSSNGTENLHKVFMHHRHRRLMGHAMV